MTLPNFFPAAPGTRAVTVTNFTLEFGPTVFGIAATADGLMCATAQGPMRVDSVLNCGSTEKGCAFGIRNPDGSIDATGRVYRDFADLMRSLDAAKLRRSQAIAALRAKQSATGGGVK